MKKLIASLASIIRCSGCLFLMAILLVPELTVAQLPSNNNSTVTVKFPIDKNALDDIVTFYLMSGSGTIENQGSNYLTVHNAQTGYSASPGGDLLVGQMRLYTDYYQIWRSFMPFNTSTLPPNCTIQSASLHLNLDSNPSYVDFDATVVQSTQASPYSLTVQDFDAVGTTSGGSVNTSQFTTLHVFYTITLNSTGISWINRTGPTLLALRSNRDLNSNEPGLGGMLAEYVAFRGMQGGSEAPYLEVTYTPQPQNPILTVTNNNLIYNWNYGQPQPSPQYFTIANTGGGTLNWNVTNVPFWLSLNPSQGSLNGDENINVYCSVVGSYPGSDQSATLTVSTQPSVQGSPQPVYATLYCHQPILTVNPTNLNYSWTQGDPLPTPQPITISNTGSGIMNWTASESISWLSLNQYSGNLDGGQSINDNCNIIGSFPGVGTYNGTIVVTAPNVQGSPQTVYVTLICNQGSSQLYAFIDDITTPFAVLIGPGNNGFTWGTYSLVTSDNHVRFYKELTLTAHGSNSQSGQPTVPITDAEWRDYFNNQYTSLGNGQTFVYPDYLDIGVHQIQVRVQNASGPSDWSTEQTIYVDPYPQIFYPFDDAANVAGPMHWSGSGFNQDLHINNEVYAMDFNGNGDDYGLMVVSPVTGIVTQAGYSGTYGNKVDIEFNYAGADYRVRIAHLSTISVFVGNTISTGNVIGAVGGTGGWSPHVHFCLSHKVGVNFISIDPHPIWLNSTTRIQETVWDPTPPYTDYHSSNWSPDPNIVWVTEEAAISSGTATLYQNTQGYRHNYSYSYGSGGTNPTRTLTYNLSIPEAGQYLVQFVANVAGDFPMHFEINHAGSVLIQTVTTIPSNQWITIGPVGGLNFASGGDQWIQVNNQGTGTKAFEDVRLIRQDQGGSAFHLVLLDSLIMEPDSIQLGDSTQISFGVFNFGNISEDPDSLIIYFIGSTGDTSATYRQELLQPLLEPGTEQWLNIPLASNNLPPQPGNYRAELHWRAVSGAEGILSCQLNIAIIQFPLTLTPLNPPIVIPTLGGSFTYNIAIGNNTGSAVICNVWCNVTLPHGNLYGPTLNPVTITMPPGFAINRNRTQSVPANAPSGNYVYHGYIGVYPSTIWNQDSFPFTKLTTVNGDHIDDWSNIGQSLDDWQQPQSIIAPLEFALKEITPNPFNPTTVISYELRDASYVTLKVYDTAGRQVTTLVNGFREAGSHQVTFDGSNLPSGVYIYHLQAGEFSATGKMVLLK